MQLLNGLYLHEMVMLALGALMFLVLLGSLVYLLTKGKPLSSLLWFFTIPLLLMGFPAFSSIQIGKGVIDITTRTRELAQNPSDPNLRAALEQAVAQVTQRTLSDPQALTAVADAQIALGQEQQAKETAEKALQADPNNQSAQQIKEQATAATTLEQTTQQVAQNPDNAQAKAELQQQIRVVTQRQVLDPELLAKVATAQAAIGEKAKAQSTAQRAVSIDPNVRMKINPKVFQLTRPVATPTP